MDFETRYAREKRRTRITNRAAIVFMIILVIVAIAIIAFLIWYFFLRPVPSTGGRGGGGGTPTPSECDNDSDCAALAICRAGECVDVQCKQNSDCNPAMTCTSNVCISNAGTACTDNDDCDSFLRCSQNTGTCLGTLGSGCTNDGQCLTPFRCADGICSTISCVDNSNCPTGSICDTDEGNTCRLDFEQFCGDNDQCSPMQDLECGGPDGDDGGPLSKCLFDNLESCSSDAQCASDNCVGAPLGFCFL